MPAAFSLSHSCPCRTAADAKLSRAGYLSFPSLVIVFLFLNILFKKRERQEGTSR